jgi:hypothetical protein
MITPHFINPFCTTYSITPDLKQEEREPIVIGGCLTDEDEYFAMCDVRPPPNKYKSII